ncbi:hypothetical protein FHW58_001692 [Duganella sp. 1224]|uniref:hypothetical protein n=1 Tax=Duganella sp. 1224 TaxID=2587052 RepID=UPI0017EA51A3|nr:hypothetical protein [Duganella sp. 1224]NYE60540.1 hypothetical protein [Duganella sp. 1224]
MNSAQDDLDARLRERLLLSRAVPGDRLMLADATLRAALDGSRALTPNERQALSSSPLTLRRFRQLSLERYAVLAAQPPQAANDPVWIGSQGMLRAASTATALDTLVTDDGHWTLHFLPQDGGWQVILSLSAEAPFAAHLLREQPQLRVIDGGGAIVLQGRLDADGECERAWPFATAPASHFQLYGAGFAVEPVAP